MAHAYLDQYGIMHIVDRKEDADKYGSGKIVETSIPNGGGYPEVDGKHVIVYTADNKFKVGGKEYPLDELKDMYPQVSALLKEIEEA